MGIEVLSPFPLSVQEQKTQPDCPLPRYSVTFMYTSIAAVKGFYDQASNPLTVWFGNPQDEYVCEETGEEVSFDKGDCRVVRGNHDSQPHWVRQQPYLTTAELGAFNHECFFFVRLGERLACTPYNISLLLRLWPKGLGAKRSITFVQKGAHTALSHGSEEVVTHGQVGGVCQG
jgi:hypothetical protein